MASIEYGVDRNGKKIYAKEAVGGRMYKCPYCFDNIHVRKCITKDDYFAHESIMNRTPQQMICKGYTGIEKNENAEDHHYIVNGGVPLHLIERTEQKFELVAFFPPLSHESMDLLKKWNAKVEISDNRTKEVYSAINLRRYNVRSATEWIKIKCTSMCKKITEVSKKWEWGIRGLNFDNDFFMSDFGGGSRVSQHSNVVIGKEYLLVRKSCNIYNIDGIKVEKKGELKLSNMRINREYDVFSFVVIEATEEAVAFVHSKGYQLTEKSDEVIPLWPPAIVEGKELIFRRSDLDAILYHEKKSKQEIYLLDKNFPIQVSEKDNLLKIQTNSNLIIVSDRDFNPYSCEIKYIITQDRENYDISKTFEPNIQWKYNAGTEETIGDSIPDKLFYENIRIVGDLRLTAITTRKNYVLRSSVYEIEKLKKGDSLYIYYEPFNCMVLIDKSIQKDFFKYNVVVINEYAKILHKCQLDYFANERLINHWIYKLGGISEEFCKILLYWKNMGKMPLVAEKILVELEEALNEKRS